MIPKTLIGKIVGLLALIAVGVAPFLILYISDLANIEMNLFFAILIVFFVVFIIAAALPFFGFDIQISSKKQDEILFKKFDTFDKLVEKARWPLVIISLSYFAVEFLWRKFGG